MRFILLRHADKERSFEANPKLSEQGRKQAQSLADLVSKGSLPGPLQLLSSPKIRAKQTLEPLSKSSGIKIQELPELLERQSHENSAQFLTRIKSTISRLEKLNPSSSGVIYAVTHFDWIEDFLAVLHSDQDFSEAHFHSWAPCQFMEFEIKDGIWHYCRWGRVDS